MSQQPAGTDNRFETKYESECEIEHNIAERFKKKERFTSQLREDTHEYYEHYESTAIDYVLEDMQRFKYLHNFFFHGNAKSYYQNIVQDKASRYIEAKKNMKDK